MVPSGLRSAARRNAIPSVPLCFAAAFTCDAAAAVTLNMVRSSTSKQPYLYTLPLGGPQTLFVAGPGAATAPYMLRESAGSIAITPDVSHVGVAGQQVLVYQSVVTTIDAGTPQDLVGIDLLACPDHPGPNSGTRGHGSPAPRSCPGARGQGACSVSRSLM